MRMFSLPSSGRTTFFTLLVSLMIAAMLPVCHDSVLLAGLDGEVGAVATESFDNLVGLTHKDVQKCPAFGTLDKAQSTSVTYRCRFTEVSCAYHTLSRRESARYVYNASCHSSITLLEPPTHE
jgi:hypothetical protein